MLSYAAFNALLKSLEEPPPHVKFIFATTESHKILPTILSRCQRYDFQRIPLRELIQRLRDIVHNEKLTADEVGLALIAREADGGLRDAQSLLDQVIAWSGGQITEQAVKDALGVADRQALFRVVDTVLSRTPAQALQLAGDLYQYGYDPRRLCRDLLEHFRHLVAAKISTDPSMLADLPDHEVAVVRQQAAECSLEDLQRFFTLLLHADEDVSKTAHPQLVIEMTLVKLASQPALMPIDEALSRLEALHKALLGNSQAALSPRTPPLPVTASSAVSPPAASSLRSIPVRREERMTLPPSIAPTDEAPAPLPRTVPASTPVVMKDEPGIWEGFLRAVQKEKISLFFPLKSAHLLELTHTTMHIGVERDLYFRELTRKESRTLLEEIDRRFFGRALTLDITKGGAIRSSPVSSLGAPTTKSAHEQPASDDPLVQTVLDVLGGEVQGTRSHRPSGEPR
jgi:DNA polymerase-3 subunit gamma/tau